MTDRDDLRRSELPDRSEMLQLALVASGTGAWRWEGSTGVVVWDPTMEELCGLEPGSFGGDLDAWREIVHPDDREWVVELLGSVLDKPRTFSYEHRIVLADGSLRWLEFRGRVVLDEDGRSRGALGCAFDVTDRKLLEADREHLISYSQVLLGRLNSLARIGGLLSGASSIQQLGRVVVDELESTDLGRSRALWVLDAAGTTLELVASLGIPDEALAAFLSISVDAELPASVAWRERRIVRSDTPEDARRVFPALVGAPRSTQGFLVVPLLDADRCEGALVVGFDDPNLSDLDVAFLQALAGHVAQSVGRARWADAAIERAEVSTARAEYERSRRERVEFLSRLTGSALVAADLQDLLDRISRSAVPRLGDWCTIHFVPEGMSEVYSSIAHIDPQREQMAREIQERFPFDIDAPGGVAEVIRSGRPQFLPDAVGPAVDEVRRRSSGEDAAEVRDTLEGLGVSSSITVPLITRSSVVGAMQFVMAESGRRYEPEDLALAEAVAGRVADAVRAAWSVDQQRSISSSLQKAFLPPRLPEAEGLRITCRYWTSDAALEVGGDFYDFFPLGEGRYAFAIGDVCGTGADAAAVTTIARHTIRAAARHGFAHTDVIEWVNGALLEGDRGRFCTVCYGTIERSGEGGWTMRSTAAGHPLPIVRRVDGTTEDVGQPGLVVGAFSSVSTTVTETVLGPGDLVVLYTDGLTDLPPPFGADSEELERVVAGVASADPDDVVDRIFEWLERRSPADGHRDDAALLVFAVE